MEYKISSQFKQLLQEYNLSCFENNLALIIKDDPLLVEHSEKTLYYSLVIYNKLQKYLKLNNTDSKLLFWSALFHDLGKYKIDKKILYKPGKLTAKEWKKIRKHSQYSVSILKKYKYLKNILPFVLYHHERYDGQGYPQKLKGENIPIIARILTIADSFDAMTSFRTYKPIMKTKEAIDELKKCSSTQFDPIITKIFINAIEQDEVEIGWRFKLFEE